MLITANITKKCHHMSKANDMLEGQTEFQKVALSVTLVVCISNRLVILSQETDHINVPGV